MTAPRDSGADEAARQHIHDLLVDLLSATDDKTRDRLTLQLMLDSPDPNILDHIHHSTAFYDDDGVLDLWAVVDHAFDA
jgi:hypothetical protein